MALERFPAHVKAAMYKETFHYITCMHLATFTN